MVHDGAFISYDAGSGANERDSVSMADRQMGSGRWDRGRNIIVQRAGGGGYVRSRERYGRGFRVYFLDIGLYIHCFSSGSLSCKIRAKYSTWVRIDSGRICWTVQLRSKLLGTEDADDLRQGRVTQAVRRELFSKVRDGLAIENIRQMIVVVVDAFVVALNIE